MVALAQRVALTRGTSTRRCLAFADGRQRLRV